MPRSPLAADVLADVLPEAESQVEIALVGGRVIDPESGLDEVTDVGVAGGRITRVGPGIGTAGQYVDCTGLVVAPGFVDLHSHAQTRAGAGLQVLDGVTTALDLECGALGVARWHDRMLAEGRPLNFGYAASWAMARAVVQGVPVDPSTPHESGFAAFQAMSAYPVGSRRLDAAQRRQVVDRLEREVADGAVAIGAMVGYLPDSEPAELADVATLSARFGIPTVVHSRSSAVHGPVTALGAVNELVAVAARTGAHLHLCHVNSTSTSWLPQIVESIEAARARGLRITTEAYPYERGSTIVGAAFLTEAELAREGRAPSSLTYLATGESIASAERLEELRATDPGGLVLTTTYDVSDAVEARLFDRALTIPHAAFASDALPSAGDIAHPRSAGCFSKVLGTLVRERGLLSLPEAIRRCTLVPAEILGEASPAMRRKGRLQVGADADITVFDPVAIADRATYRTLRPSYGVRHVLVAGAAVVQDGRLLPDALPGRPITRHEEGS